MTSAVDPSHRGVRFSNGNGEETFKDIAAAGGDVQAASESTISAAEASTIHTPTPRKDTTKTGTMDRPDLNQQLSSGSASASSDSDTVPDGTGYGTHHPVNGGLEYALTGSHSPMDELPPMVNASNYGWAAGGATRSRGGVPTNVNTNGDHAAGRQEGPNGITVNTSMRGQRPTAMRTPSNTYNPQRRPNQYSLNNTQNRHRNSSATRSRRNPNADYRAQERAYLRVIRQNEAMENDAITEPRTPSLGYSTDSETDDESPSTGDIQENDPYDQETLLYFGNEDLEPSIEEIQIPANRERLEWHSMLASVLTGDVVKQEKKRLTGGFDQQGDSSLKMELWIGIRARVCGRTVAAQRRVVEDGRSKLKTLIEEIIAFEIQGETEVGKTPAQQVQEMVGKIERCESLYPTRQDLEAAHPRVASDAYRASCDAVIAWHNTTEMINTELGILQSWVGNEDLDFLRPRAQPQDEHSHLNDESPFIDRILKEDGLKSLQGDNSLLIGVDKVINKAKVTLIKNAQAFMDRHLPPYIEELLTLINFPSRLVQEIIRVRLKYAKKMKDQTQQGVMMAEQMISQFHILLTLAVGIREAYNKIAQPQPGWDLPPCIDENFDRVVLDALKFYFRMLNWKLSANKNTFKEAEILEQEWGFFNELGKHLEGGDLEVAEQFSSLTSKSLLRLTTSFERELQRRPDDIAVPEVEKRYKQILDSVRVRQRKLFRFSKVLTQRFENATEYNINIDREQYQELIDSLIMSGHILLEFQNSPDSNQPYFIASPSLADRLKDIQSLLGTCNHAEDALEDPSNPYVLVLKPEETLYWDSRKMEADFAPPHLDLKNGILRLVADGAQQRLINANLAFQTVTGMDLHVIIDKRANIPRINQELQRIRKTAYKLSNTIMDSVEIIRKQTAGLEVQELIQTCFAFATEFGQRSVLYIDPNRRQLNNMKLTKLALDWVSFICDDCVASDRKTFRWAVTALEFAMLMTRGQNILGMSEDEYETLRIKVAGCMSLLVSHFDIMGARSTMAAIAEKQRLESIHGKFRLDISRLKDDEESARMVREQWLEQLNELDAARKQKEAERQALGRVLEDSNEADRAIAYLSSSATNVTYRWQQGMFVGGGTFGNVYAATNLDSGLIMAVKEIKLTDPQLIPTIISQIRDEMGVLQVLDHPNIVSYYGIEPHRDRVYIFMEYCSGGSLAQLLEHGRIEDETIIQVYALQMLEGLAYLHQAGVVHRDIKPENVLLDANGLIKFVDFGAAKVIARQGKTLVNDERAGRQRSMTGTPMYMSPEVIKGQAGGRHGAVDIWSLGCVILEMATGRRPWATYDNEWAIMYNIAQGNPPQLPTKEQMSEQGIEFLKKCFERDPSKRASAVELLNHEWIMTLKSQFNFGETTPQTPQSENGSGTGSLTASRQNTPSLDAVEEAVEAVAEESPCPQRVCRVV